jgi:hypothetical protein
MNISSILLQQFRQKSLYAILLLIKVQSSAIPSCIVYSPLVQFPFVRVGVSKVPLPEGQQGTPVLGRGKPLGVSCTQYITSRYNLFCRNTAGFVYVRCYVSSESGKLIAETLSAL